MTEEVRLHFIGTATMLLRYRGLTLLTDPNFLHRGQRASLGYGLWSRRRTEPALRVSELPPVDAVVLSHLHGDHFDRVARAGLDKGLPLFTTRQAARVLRAWGFHEADGMRTYERRTVGGAGAQVSITSLPGVHAPGPMRALLPSVMGSLLEFEYAGEVELRAYITGDTLVRPHIDEIARRWPDIDVVIAHLGGTRVLGVLVTMDAAQGVELLRRIRPRSAVPVHYDDYPVFKSPLGEFRTAMQASGLDVDVSYVDRGELISLRRD
jgi:L-ascorbate metabolism protein UlaG (beta-lactamase superfamily)